MNETRISLVTKFCHGQDKNLPLFDHKKKTTGAGEETIHIGWIFGYENAYLIAIDGDFLGFASEASHK